MLWRYFKANFTCWFGLIFAAVGVVCMIPAVFLLGSDQPLWLAGMVAGLGLVFFLPGAYLARRGWRDIQRRVRAISRGQLVAGHVDNIVKANVEVNGRPRYTVQWSWEGPDGKVRGGKSPALERERANRWKRGGEIAVYADLADPEAAEADVYGFRSPVP